MHVLNPRRPNDTLHSSHNAKHLQGHSTMFLGLVLQTTHARSIPLLSDDAGCAEVNNLSIITSRRIAGSFSLEYCDLVRRLFSWNLHLSIVHTDRNQLRSEGVCWVELGADAIIKSERASVQANSALILPSFSVNSLSLSSSSSS